MNKPFIFIFWSKYGKQLTPGHLLCLECLKKNCGDDFDIIFLDEDNVQNYADLIPNWQDEIDVVKRADYLRTEVIYKNGGIWIDTDILVMKSLKEIWNAVLQDPDHVFIHGDAFFGSLPQTPFITLSREIIKTIYLSGKRNLLSKTFKEVRRRNPQWRYHQSEKKESIYIYNEPNSVIKDFNDISMVIFFFSHKEKYKKIWKAASPFDAKTKEEILESKEPFGTFFKNSLLKSS